MDISFSNMANHILLIFKALDIQTLITLAACLVAVLSLIETKRANKISSDSLSLTKQGADTQRTVAIEEVKADILTGLSDERELCKEAWVELCTLKVNHDADPEPIKRMLTNYNNLFEVIPQLEKTISEIDALYSKIKNLKPGNQVELIQMKTEYYRIRKDTFYALRRYNYCMNEFKEKRQLALTKASSLVHNPSNHKAS